MKQKQYASKWKTERRTHQIAHPPPRDLGNFWESWEADEDGWWSQLRPEMGGKGHKTPQKTCWSSLGLLGKRGAEISQHCGAGPSSRGTCFTFVVVVVGWRTRGHRGKSPFYGLHAILRVQMGVVFTPTALKTSGKKREKSLQSDCPMCWNNSGFWCKLQLPVTPKNLNQAIKQSKQMTDTATIGQ